MLQVQGVPAVFAIKNGQVLENFVGIPPGENAISDFLDKSLGALDQPEDADKK